MKIWKPMMAAACGVLLCGCGSKEEGADFPPYDNSGEYQAWLEENSEKYVFETIEDLPEGLNWENGADLPDIGSLEARKGGTLHRVLSDFPRTLRTVGPDSNGGFRPFLQDEMSMSYVEKHPNVEGWYPGLAEEWAVDQENNRVFIRIDPEAKWGDGEPVTTEDTVFMFYFHTSPHTNAPWYQDFYDKKYSRITVYDDRTFSVTVADRRPDFASYVFGIGPRPRHFYKEHGPDFVQRYQWRYQPITGAYLLRDEDIVKGRSVALTRNPEWWAKDRKFWRNRFNPDRIELKVVRDTDKAFESFLAGEIDFFRLNLSKYWHESLPDDHPLVRKGYVHKATFYNDIPRGTLGLWINTTKPLLDDVHVRRGLHHASNWSLVIDKFFRGDWQRLRTTADGYGEASRTDLEPREFSVEKAEAEFAKAGFTQRGPDGVLVNGKGQRLSFNLSTGYQAYADLLTILKQEALKAGVEFKLEILDSTAGWKKAQEKKHEIAFAGTSSSTTEIYPRYWDFWHSDNAYREDGKPKPQTNNLSATALPELDKLIDRYDKSEDHGEKIGLAHQIDGIVHEHAAWVPGVDMQFYRVGYWRWVKWPEDFNVKLSEIERSYWVHWIDEDTKRETLAAMEEGKTFEPSIEVYDQYRPE